MSDVREYRTNQGRLFSTILEDAKTPDLQAAADAMWLEARRHPATSACECPVIEALAVLYERGFRLVKEDHA